MPLSHTVAPRLILSTLQSRGLLGLPACAGGEDDTPAPAPVPGEPWLFSVRVGGQVGLIDARGRMVVEPQQKTLSPIRALARTLVRVRKMALSPTCALGSI